MSEIPIRHMCTVNPYPFVSLPPLNVSLQNGPRIVRKMQDESRVAGWRNLLIYRDFSYKVLTLGESEQTIIYCPHCGMLLERAENFIPDYGLYMIRQKRKPLDAMDLDQIRETAMQAYSIHLTDTMLKNAVSERASVLGYFLQSFFAKAINQQIECLKNVSINDRTETILGSVSHTYRLINEILEEWSMIFYAGGPELKGSILNTMEQSIAFWILVFDDKLHGEVHPFNAYRITSEGKPDYAATKFVAILKHIALSDWLQAQDKIEQWIIHVLEAYKKSGKSMHIRLYEAVSATIQKCHPKMRAVLKKNLDGISQTESLGDASD